MMRLMMEAAMVMGVLAVLVLLVKMGGKNDNANTRPPGDNDDSGREGG